MSVSKTILIGNLGGDPDVRFMPNGNAVANITLATSEKWKDKQTGQIQERTEWHRVVFYGKLAEVVGKYLKKGSKIYVEGRNQTREWEKDGVKRYTTEVIVDMRGTMQMLDGRGDGQGATQGGKSSAPAANQQQSRAANQAPAQQRQAPVADANAGVTHQATTPDYNSFDDDIPFDKPYKGRNALLV